MKTPFFLLSKLLDGCADQHMLGSMFVIGVRHLSPFPAMFFTLHLGLPRPQPTVRDENQFCITRDEGHFLRHFIVAVWKLAMLLECFEKYNAHGRICTDAIKEIGEFLHDLQSKNQGLSFQTFL